MAPAFGEDDPGILFIRPANLFIRPGHGPVEFGYCLGFYKPTATPQSDGVLPQEPPPHPPPQSTPARTSRGGERTTDDGNQTNSPRQPLGLSPKGANATSFMPLLGKSFYPADAFRSAGDVGPCFRCSNIPPLGLEPRVARVRAEYPD